MAYVSVPKDLSKVKSKIAFNLTKRQLLCFSGAALLGFPVYLCTKDALGTSTAGILMVLIMAPFFFLAMYEKDGRPLEVLLKNIIVMKFKRPGIRPYKTKNIYATLEQTEEKGVKRGADKYR